MDLRIKEINGVFSVFGNLNNQNISQLQEKITDCFLHRRQAVINLTSLVQMDNTSAIVLQKLYTNALRRNLNLLIVGRENKIVYNVMTQMCTSYILGESAYQHS
ncbi:STAS domain-containing protein [Maribacter sp. CXY002]|uniref:STAS domain-containing protein n=1 Tax=Maribacter luteocoastalis TaxID=3407671 RepID=UPI003B677D67